MEYTVSDTDTIERIAAVHDCTVGELAKLNKMGSRMVNILVLYNWLKCVIKTADWSNNANDNN